MNLKNLINSSIEVDLHNMSVLDGKRLLERTIMSAPKNVMEITVIHGYRHGKGMLNMVRKELKCRRIDRKILTMNNGITILTLKREW